MPEDEKKSNIPIPKVSNISKEDMSDTAIFLTEKIGEAFNTANQAHELASTAHANVKALSDGINQAEILRKREIDQMREAFKESNERNSDAYKGLTQQLGALNKNISEATVAIAGLNNLKENQISIKEELAGQSERLSSHITEQATVEATTDTKLKNLIKNTANDYDRLDGSINTFKQEFKQELKDAIREVAPSVQLVKFVKWLVSIIIIAVGVTWTIVQIYDKVSSNMDKNNTNPPPAKEAVIPERSSEITNEDHNSSK